MALGLVLAAIRPDSGRMANDTAQHSTQHTAPDAWRDTWVDPDTARINARMAEVRHTESDMAEFYRMARNAIS